MNDNDIIKALEDSIHKMKECCVTNWDFYASGDFVKNILDLINRQKAENTELQLKNSELESDLRLKTYDYEHLLMKCKEIQAISSSRKDRLMQTVIKLQVAKSEAIKEFAERYKKEIFKTTHFNGYVYSDLVLSIFDNLVKEMTEGKE